MNYKMHLHCLLCYTTSFDAYYIIKENIHCYKPLDVQQYSYTHLLSEYSEDHL
jgi:hypothetical protein